MKKTIRLTEGELRRIISESVKRVLREMDNDYSGNDLDYNSIILQALSIIPRMHKNGQKVSWVSVAEEMGFRLETLNDEDMELLKDAIEDAMMEDENDSNNMPYANEAIKRMVSESVRRVLKEDHKYTQLRNILGITDNDEWNAAAETERKEDLASEIWRAIAKLAGGNPREKSFKFSDMANMLKAQFGFKYVGSNDEQEYHEFSNGEDTLTICPDWFYTKQGQMSIDNMDVS